MISIITVIALCFVHFFADFICQSDWMAQNKSSSNKALGLHVVCYSIPFLLFGLKFAIVTGILHFIIDYITSRITKKLWEKKQVHNFFVVVGFDQFLHVVSLLLTYRFLGVQ